jgi:hypothetical protein
MEFDIEIPMSLDLTLKIECRYIDKNILQWSLTYLQESCTQKLRDNKK